MTHLQSMRPERSVLLSILMAVLLIAIPGCKGGPKSSSTATAPSASASAGAVASGPCADYAQKICEKAGDESPTCQSFKAATDLMTPGTCKAGLKDVNHSFKQLAAVRGPCDTLVKNLCDAVGPKTDACAMVTTQTKQFPVDRCKMMQEHLPQIVADLKKMEAAKQPLAAELTAALSEGPVPSFGPADAKVKIVEFSDFECPFCSKAADVVNQIKKKYGDKVHFAFRQFPLPNHTNAHVAAQASLAANAQGKFWEFHDRMFENQRALDRAALEQYAQQLGLDVGAFKKSLDDKKFATQVDADMKLGEKVSVQGTPTLFINGQRVENPTDFAAVTSMIDQALGGTSPG